MASLKDMKEFIYKLDGKYYIIGGCEFGECDDQELIDLFQKFVILTEDEEFKYDVREMQKAHRNKIADVYKDLLDRCHVSIESSQMTERKALLRGHLEQQFDEEINKQLECWLKADTCLAYKDIDEKVDRERLS